MCHFRGPSVRCCLLIAINERQDFSIHSFNQEWQKVSCKSGAVMLLICWVLNYKNVCHILAAGEGRPATSRGFRWGQDYSRRLSCGMSRIIFWCVSLFIGVTLINAVNYYHKELFTPKHIPLVELSDLLIQIEMRRRIETMFCMKSMETETKIPKVTYVNLKDIRKLYCF